MTAGPDDTTPSTASPARAVGVDIGKGCWIACGIDQRVRWVREFDTFEEVLDAARAAVAIAVDVPVRVEEGWRECDAAAKKLLGSRSSTLFLTPPRAALRAEDYATAREVALQQTGKSVSAQAFNLGSRILEVEGHAADDDRIHEVHPELSFAAMAGESIVEPKTTWNGQMRRRRLLDANGLPLLDHLEHVGRSAPDDVLDAVAAAWSARRIADGCAERIPAGGDGAAIWR